jgi:hypothetical protein
MEAGTLFVPTLSEVVDMSVDFATRFVAQQGDFARRLARAIDPIVGASYESSGGEGRVAISRRSRNPQVVL